MPSPVDIDPELDFPTILSELEAIYEYRTGDRGRLTKQQRFIRTVAGEVEDFANDQTRKSSLGPAIQNDLVLPLIHHTPENDAQLWWWVKLVLNFEIPVEQHCEDHVSPFEAFSFAYFAKDNMSIWKSSRGLGGKSAQLSALSLTEAITLGASVTLLGGSFEQSHRVHEYMRGDHDNFPLSYWGSRVLVETGAKDKLLKSEPTKGRTQLTNSGRVHALKASQQSVRGPHPQRLRGDEVDEMDPAIWDAAKGQAMESRGIEEQIVGSSTHQYPDGTMTKEIDEAEDNGFPVHHWCFRETVATNEGGWLSEDQISRKKRQVTDSVWKHEYDLQEPVPEGRAIETENIERMFDPDLGSVGGELGTRFTAEQPSFDEETPIEEREEQYAVGADWGKKRDRTIIAVLRADVEPLRFVAYYHLARQPWPDMVGRYSRVVEKYDATAAHDATGIGEVIHDYLDVTAEGVSLNGAKRDKIFNQYIMAIENDDIRCPMIQYMYREHKHVTVDDLHGGGHPADTFVAGALAYRAALAGWRTLIL